MNLPIIVNTLLCMLDPPFTKLHSRFECSGLARRLPPDLARNSSRRVRLLELMDQTAIYITDLYTDLMTEPSCEHLYLSVQFSLLVLTATTRDAVATDIVHQHSGRLDYYKGYVLQGCASIFNTQIPNLSETSHNSIQQNQKETRI